MRSYNENEYANSRLKGTIVRIGDIPVHIVDIGRLGVRYFRLSDGDMDDKYHVCRLDDLNIDPVPLGYINSQFNGAIYMTRSPVREDWRQGLREVSMRAVLPNDERNYRPSFGELDQVIRGKYPKLEMALELVNFPVAFSRSFAVGKENQLFYKGKWKVGNIDKRKNYNLLPNFHWVSDELEEELAAA